MAGSRDQAVSGRGGGAGRRVLDPAPAAPTWRKAEAQLDQRLSGAVRQDTLTEFEAGAASFATPGLVLVGAIGIFEGYQWLHLFPSGPLWPVSLLIALVVAPATFALTHFASAPRWLWLRRLARASALFVLVLGIVVAIAHPMLVGRALGIISLVLSGSVLSLAAASEYRRNRPVRID